MKYKAITPIVASLAVTMALAGCSSGTKDASTAGTAASTAATSNTPSQTASAKDSTLRVLWWGSQPRHDATNKVIDMYKKDHSNVSFQPEFQGFDGYWQKVTLQAATNNMPDVLQYYVGSADTQQFMDKNLIAPLDDLVAKKLIDISDISESALSSGKLGGKLYGIPLGVNAKAMVVDPEAYQKAGLTIPVNGYATWEDLGKDLVKLKAVTGSYGADDLLGENFMFPYYARQMGQVQYADKTGIGFDEKTYVDFYTMKKNWSKDGLIPPIDVFLSIKSPEESNIAKKKSAINVIYTNQFESISKAAGKELQLIPLPGPNAIKAMDLRPGNHFSIPSNSTNKEEAAKFISYFVNNVDANKVLNAERGMPVAGKVREGIKDGFTPAQKVAAAYIDQVAKASSPMDPQPPAGSTEIEKLMLDLEQQILYNKTTPEQAYATLKSESLKILDKNKK
ncbi:ABC transporter substrate-binding protein [Paenibacillus qinlingensis]|uniref:ABC transporter substrate-binding protein n=1 Tax=Paenibacillus qinlingensis TaxID=1837343 RepID=UPI0015652E6F|nr:extracellular solute-binding protein [Paenibacillus qinlingensis]NQX61084.1 extracellular solute-binding protein [Paenibacillus qinlingensis]